MSTAAQQAASRQNSQHSTGPRTDAGKIASSLNANRHNLTGRLLIRDDEKEAFEAFEQSHRDQIQPTGALELTFFDQLLSAGWNLRRLESLEAQALADFANESSARQFDRLTRYRGQHERAFLRALRELKALQTAREILDRLAKPQKTTFAPLTDFTQLKRVGFVLSKPKTTPDSTLEWLKSTLYAQPPSSSAQTL